MWLVYKTTTHCAHGDMLSFKVLCHQDLTSKAGTVGSHLSELQLSEHVGYPNAFSKATPTISGYFRRISGLTLPVVWQLKAQDNFYGQGRLRNKDESNCQSPQMGTASLLHEMETEQQLTVVRILVIITYTVSGT